MVGDCTQLTNGKNYVLVIEYIRRLLGYNHNYNNGKTVALFVSESLQFIKTKVQRVGHVPSSSQSWVR